MLVQTQLNGLVLMIVVRSLILFLLCRHNPHAQMCRVLHLTLVLMSGWWGRWAHQRKGGTSWVCLGSCLLGEQLEWLTGWCVCQQMWPSLVIRQPPLGLTGTSDQRIWNWWALHTTHIHIVHPHTHTHTHIHTYMIPSYPYNTTVCSI